VNRERREEGSHDRQPQAQSRYEALLCLKPSLCGFVGDVSDNEKMESDCFAHKETAKSLLYLFGPK
jgi:hypothetical protein